jgi:hypothetical protein
MFSYANIFFVIGCVFIWSVKYSDVNVTEYKKIFQQLGATRFPFFVLVSSSIFLLVFSLITFDNG